MTPGRAVVFDILSCADLDDEICYLSLFPDIRPALETAFGVRCVMDYAHYSDLIDPCKE